MLNFLPIEYISDQTILNSNTYPNFRIPPSPDSATRRVVDGHLGANWHYLPQGGHEHEEHSYPPSGSFQLAPASHDGHSAAYGLSTRTLIVRG